MKQDAQIPLPPDGEGLHVIFTGGLRAAKLDENEWQITPVFLNGAVCVKQSLTKIQVQTLANNNDFHPIAFHLFGWKDGEYYSRWTPIVPGRANHFLDPAHLWLNIAGNIGRRRIKSLLKDFGPPVEDEISKMIDKRDRTEALAQYISISLRNMYMSLEQIAEHYNEQLVNHMLKRHVNGEQSINTLSQTLNPHVHSFYLHFGAARDHLGALVAHRIGFGKKVDSMARLVKKLGQTSFPKDALLDLLIASGYIVSDPENPGEYTSGGWLRHASEIRNDFVHECPYGTKDIERWGCVIPVQEELGLYRYFRAIELNGNGGQDVCDVLYSHAATCTDLMRKAAEALGYDTTIMHITDDDVVPI